MLTGAFDWLILNQTLLIPLFLIIQYTLGLIFDLTKSTRFYHRREIEEHGCAYVKVACKGKEECPTEEQVNLFTGVVNNFLRKNKDNGKKIGVHCTHGFNRTGFMIVSYLVLECNYRWVNGSLILIYDIKRPNITFLIFSFIQFGTSLKIVCRRSSTGHLQIGLSSGTL